MIEHIVFKEVSCDHFDRNVLSEYGSVSFPVTRQGSVDSEIHKFEGIELYTRRLNSTGVITESYAPADKLFFELPNCIQTYRELPDEGDCQAAMVRPGDASVWYQKADSSKWVLSLTNKEFDSLIPKVDQEIILSLSRDQKRRHLDRHGLLSLSRLSRSLVNEMNNPFLASREKIEALVSEIFACYSALLEQESNSISYESSNSREAILLKAVNYIHGNFHTKIKPVDVANECCTSLRNLQLVFRIYFEITPNQYLNRLRMYQFHQQLANSRNVTEAAFSSGLFHLGRASTNYLEEFGNKPSQELMRHVSRMGMY